MTLTALGLTIVAIMAVALFIARFLALSDEDKRK